MADQTSRLSNRFIFFNDLLIHESKNNTAYFLNTDNQKMIIVRKIEYRNRDNVLIKEKYYWQEYNLNDIIILPDGNIHCDFDLARI